MITYIIFFNTTLKMSNTNQQEAGRRVWNPSKEIFEEQDEITCGMKKDCDGEGLEPVEGHYGCDGCRDEDEKRKDCIEWIVKNMRACEEDTLPEKWRELFIDMLEERKDTDIAQEAFRRFNESKTSP